MVKENHAERDAQQGSNGDNSSRPFGHLQGVVIAATWAFIALLLASLFWPNLTERTKFFSANFWNLVIAFAVIAQVKINQKQWKSMLDGVERTDTIIGSMREQLSAMKQEAAATVSSAETAERALRVTEKQIELMIQNERAYIGIRRISPMGLDDDPDQDGKGFLGVKDLFS